MHYKLCIIKKSSFNYNNVTIPILFCNTAFFFKNNENGRGCEAHEREGAKKALSWGFVFKNHNSQNHKSIKKAAIVADCGFFIIVYT